MIFEFGNPDRKKKNKSPLDGLSPTEKLARAEELHDAKMGNLGANIATNSQCDTCPLEDMCHRGNRECHASTLYQNETARHVSTELTLGLFRQVVPPTGKPPQSNK